MNLVVLHKFDGFDPWGTRKGQRIVVNFDYVKRFYEREEVTHDGSFRRSGMVTHIIDNDGRDILVAETQSEIEEMLTGGIKNV